MGTLNRVPLRALRPGNANAIRAGYALRPSTAAEHYTAATVFGVPPRPTLGALRPALSRLALDAFPTLTLIALRPPDAFTRRP